MLADGNSSYVHGVSGLVSEKRGGTSKFYHEDGLGSVRALTSSSGSVTDSRSTDAFGTVVASSGSTPTPFGFAGNHGYQQDSETGLMRLGHRMYDASTGRFISRDTIRDGYNWYIYCENDPINAIDPEGLAAEEVGKCQKHGRENCLGCHLSSVIPTCKHGAYGGAEFCLGCKPVKIKLPKEPKEEKPPVKVKEEDGKTTITPKLPINLSEDIELTVEGGGAVIVKPSPKKPHEKIEAVQKTIHITLEIILRRF